MLNILEIYCTFVNFYIKTKCDVHEDNLCTNAIKYFQEIKKGKFVFYFIHWRTDSIKLRSSYKILCQKSVENFIVFNAFTKSSYVTLIYLYSDPWDIFKLFLTNQIVCCKFLRA